MKSSRSKSAVRRLATARVISFTGGEAAIVALAYTIYQRTGSSIWLSAVLILTFGTIGVLSPAAGALGDRFDRRRVMIASDLVGAACWVALAFAHAPWALLALAFAAAAAEAPFLAASGGAIPNLAGREGLSWANSLVSMGQNAGMMLGPALGGLLLAAIGSSAVFLLNAGSFVLSAALVWTIRARFAGDRSDEDRHRGLAAGYRFVWRDRVLRTIIVAWVVLLLGIGLIFVAEVPLALSFGVGSIGYGLIAAGFGCGAVLGSLAGRFLATRHERLALVGGAVSIAIGLLTAAITPWFSLVLAGMVFGGLGEGFGEVAEQNVFQRRTPDAVRSRVMAAIESSALVTIAVSLAFAGFVVDAIGARASYVAAACAAFAGACIMVAAFIGVPGVRPAAVAPAVPEAPRGEDAAREPERVPAAGR